MKNLLAVVLLALAAKSHGQPIGIAPTNYSMTVLNQNLSGGFWGTVTDNSLDTVTLGERVLTFQHVVYFDAAYMGTKGGGPKLLEDVYRFRQIGGAAYVPISGERITYFAPKASGGWIARTNYVSPIDMEPLVFWLPTYVGVSVAGDRAVRVTRTARSLECWGRNLMNEPYLLRVPCMGSAGRFDFLWRFEKNQRKSFIIGAGPAGAPWLVFDLEATEEEPL